MQYSKQKCAIIKLKNSENLCVLILFLLLIEKTLQDSVMKCRSEVTGPETIT